MLCGTLGVAGLQKQRGGGGWFVVPLASQSDGWVVISGLTDRRCAESWQSKVSEQDEQLAVEADR